MHIVEQLTSQQSLRQLNPAELELGLRVLKTNLGLQPNERVLIVTDSLMKEVEAAIWFEAAKKVTSKVSLVVLEGMTHSGQEPPAELITLCTQSDIALFQTTYSLTHTSASKAAQSRGARVASLPGVNLALVNKLLAINYAPIRDLGTKLKAKLEAGNQLTITSPLGTNLTAGIRQSQVIDDNGFIAPGTVGNLPAGEVFFCPVDNSTNGTWVVNGSLADEDDLDQPVVITIENGQAVKFEGGQAAQRLEAKLKAVGPEALIVAEIGIGTNPAADPQASLIEAEKAYATAHLAFGNSQGFGGPNAAPIHLDGLTLDPTITINDEVIVKNRQFQL
jgi:leucyl aminopeptidase (aminopeptidase T)